MAVIARSDSASRTLPARIRRVLKRPQFWFALVVLVPWLIWYLVFVYRPIFLGLEMSVLKYNLIEPAESVFVGLKNIQDVFTYDRFWIALRNTFAYAGLSYVLMMPVALLVSWCLVSLRRFRRIYEFIVFLPVVVSMVAISMLFRMLMDPQMGTFNQILRMMGLPTGQWINSSDTALPSIVAVDVWKSLGFYVILLSTAMLNIPESLYDAAKVDGATGWKMFRHIVLPLIANTLILVSVVLVIGTLQVYVSVTVLGPGPGTSTLVINQLIVAEGFTSWRFGFATAISLVMFAIILVLTVIQLRVLQPRWDY
jgi:ABC-type sugar transport system permease subunit